MSRHFRFCLVPAMVCLSGLAMPGYGSAAVSNTATGTQAPASATVFSGDLVYRARIALPEDAVAVIELRAGPEEKANVIAEQRSPLRGAQVPIPFALATKTLQGGVDYRLRALILVRGKPAWVSDPIAVESTGKDVGPVLMKAVAAEPFASSLRCGTQEIVISPDEKGLSLRVGNTTQVLKSVPSSSGKKYEAVDDSGTFFWSKGKSGTLQLKGKRYPECVDAGSVRPVFTARGNEPGWRVQVFDRLCKDSMTGMPYPKSVEITMNRKSYKGCGGDPADLLLGDEWKIESISGVAVIGNSNVTLKFDENGRVGGSSSCNRYSGEYTLSGEGINFGKMAGTMMACTPELMAQEQSFLKVLAAVQRFSIRDDGALILDTGKQQLLARRL